MKRKNKILILIFFFLIILLSTFYFLKNQVKEKSSEPEIFSYQNPSKISTSVYDFMKDLQKKGELGFKEKDYPGMGKFIEEINGIKNGEKNWIYYVNGKKATVGVSNYKLNEGDIVSWKYELY
jgi:hypothetical protein